MRCTTERSWLLLQEEALVEKEHAHASRLKRDVHQRGNALSPVF